MKPTQLHPGHYWRSGDPADIWFNEHGIEQPETIRCFNTHDHLNRGESRTVAVSSLEFVAAGLFGEARPGVAAPIRWTGDSHRYGLYRNVAEWGCPSIVMLECHGGGMRGYLFDHLVANETWEFVARSMPPEMIWNLCKQISDVYETGRMAERESLFRAFAEGRMRKRRKSGRVRVEITPAPL